MRIGIIIVIILFGFGVSSADLPVYHDNQFIERLQTDERGREILSFVDYDGLPITGTVQSFKENENKIFQVVDGLVQGIATIERMSEKITNLTGESKNKTDSDDEDELILIQRDKQVWKIPYEKGIIDGTVFVYDKNNNLINEQIYGTGVKTAESFYRPNSKMYKYIQYFPNDRVVPLQSEEKLYDENGNLSAQSENTFYDTGILQQRIETTYDDKGKVLSSFSSSYDLEGNLIDGAFESEKKIPFEWQNVNTKNH